MLFPYQNANQFILPELPSFPQIFHNTPVVSFSYFFYIYYNIELQSKSFCGTISNYNFTDRYSWSRPGQKTPLASRRARTLPRARISTHHSGAGLISYLQLVGITKVNNKIMNYQTPTWYWPGDTVIATIYSTEAPCKLAVSKMYIYQKWRVSCLLVSR